MSVQRHLERLPTIVQVTDLARKSCSFLAARLQALEVQIESGDEQAWAPYLDTVRALSVLLPHVQPGARGELLSTAEMASRMGISSRTLLKQRKAGKVRPALELGRRGRAAIKWRAE